MQGRVLKIADLATRPGRPGVLSLSESTIRRDYFPHLSPEKFFRKVGLDEIRIPFIRMDPSQKSTKGVHIPDLSE